MEHGGGLAGQADRQQTDGLRTVVTLRAFDSEEARDAAVSTGMTDGMEMSDPLLDVLLAERDPRA